MSAAWPACGSGASGLLAAPGAHDRRRQHGRCADEHQRRIQIVAVRDEGEAGAQRFDRRERGERRQPRLELREMRGRGRRRSRLPVAARRADRRRIRRAAARQPIRPSRCAPAPRPARPRMIRRPLSPSTSDRTVSAAITSSRPGMAILLMCRSECVVSGRIPSILINIINVSVDHLRRDVRAARRAAADALRLCQPRADGGAARSVSIRAAASIRAPTPIA